MSRPVPSVPVRRVASAAAVLVAALVVAACNESSPTSVLDGPARFIPSYDGDLAISVGDTLNLVQELVAIGAHESASCDSGDPAVVMPLPEVGRVLGIRTGDTVVLCTVRRTVVDSGALPNVAETDVATYRIRIVVHRRA